MRRWSTVFVGLLVVMSSCGKFPEGPRDTDGVANQTPAVPEESVENPEAVEPLEPGRTPVPPGPAVGEGTKVGFAAGTRFVVFARDGEPSFVVFDHDRGETFRVLGEPMGEPRTTYDRYTDMGVTTGALQWGLQSSLEGRILVRSTGGVQLVDLAERGHMIAAWRGTPGATSVAPDGKTFAVTTPDAVHIVRASDGAIASFAGPFSEYGGGPHWGDANVFWIAGDKLTRVDRETLRATSIKAAAEGAQWAMSDEADVIAVGAGGSVAVYGENVTTPILRIATPDVSQIFVQADGANVVWVERVIDEKTFSDKGHLHTIDVAAKTHVRFAMKNSGCGNAPEVVEKVLDGKITTDPSCSIGCPSVRWTHRTVTYDAKNGTILTDTSYKEEQSWNEEQGALREAVETKTKKLHVDIAQLSPQPKHDAFLVERASGLTLTPLKDGEPVALEASKGASLGTLTFSSDGTVIAGTVGDRARVWDAATGRALLR